MREWVRGHPVIADFVARLKSENWPITHREAFAPACDGPHGTVPGAGPRGRWYPAEPRDHPAPRGSRSRTCRRYWWSPCPPTSPTSFPLLAVRHSGSRRASFLSNERVHRLPRLTHVAMLDKRGLGKLTILFLKRFQGCCWCTPPRGCTQGITRRRDPWTRSKDEKIWKFCLSARPSLLTTLVIEVWFLRCGIYHSHDDYGRNAIAGNRSDHAWSWATRACTLRYAWVTFPHRARSSRREKANLLKISRHYL